jgi:prepilin-type N-terminal cleavage/methylation domain-containing protein
MTAIELKKAALKRQKGFSMPELIIVLLVLAILVTLALPQIISSRRLFRFSAMQRQIAASLTDARQEAMGQRTPVTFRYDDNTKEIKLYGGKYGASGDSKNLVIQLADSGLDPNDVRYGRPAGVSAAALGDGTNLTNLTSNAIDITFQSDGSVIDASNNPQNFSVFFYHAKHTAETAFAVSVLGAGGRAKVWRYNQQTNSYVE